MSSASTPPLAPRATTTTSTTTTTNSTSDRLISISYTCIPTTLPLSSTTPTAPSTSLWDRLSPSLHSQLPLRNLHWKSTTRSIRTIQALDVQFRPLESFETGAPLGLLERPYLHLCFVACDDNEHYRSTLRSQIREWLDYVIAKHKQEWLIVHVPTSTSAGGAGGGLGGVRGSGTAAKFYQRKGNVVDKIKADFNTGRMDRCVSIPFPSLPEDPQAWAEFTTKMKEGVISTFNTNVVLYEEDIRKADSQRQLEGWQYTAFFLQKEALADCFHSMNLLEDALMQYDELEASYFQTLKDQRLHPLSHSHPTATTSTSTLMGNAGGIRFIGGTKLGDDSLPLLSYTNKPYRRLLLSNSISVFDFRTYLFARQAGLLGEMGRLEEVAKRGEYFVSTFTRTLRDHQDTLGHNFIESWTYSACLNLVDDCTRRSSLLPPSVSQQSFKAVTAELLDLARKQLDKIGISAGHLPMCHPFSMSLNEVLPPVPIGGSTSDVRGSHSPATGSSSAFGSPSSSPVQSLTTQLPTLQRPRSDDQVVTRVELKEALGDREKFDELYVALTNRAIGAYQGVGRRRCGLKLYGSLAALEDHRDRTSSAQKLYSPLPAHYVDHQWSQLEASLLTHSTRLQGQLDMKREQLLSTLALVRAGVEYGSGKWELGDYESAGLGALGMGMGLVEEGRGGEEGRQERLAQRLMKDVRDLSGTLAKDFAAIAFPTFSMRLASERGATAVGEDGLTVKLIIKSILPCSLAVDEVRLKFSTPEGEQIWFTSAGCTLIPGDTEATLFCPTPVVGRVSLELSQIRFSRIIFQYSHKPGAATDPRSTAPSSVAAIQPTISFPRDPQALNVYTEAPLALHLDQRRKVIICIGTGRNELVKVAVRVSTPARDVSLGFSDAALVSGSAVVTPSGGDFILLENAAAASTIKVELPIIGALRNPTLELSIAVEYFTSKRPTTRRTLRRNVEFDVALPVAVNVQDYFRSDCLLSKFAVTTGGSEALRIKSAVLEGPDDVVVKSSRTGVTPLVTLVPLQSSNFLFKISRPTTKAHRLLRLSLTYCSVSEEFLAKVLAVVEHYLASAPPSVVAEAAWITSSVLYEAEACTHIDTYCYTSHLRHLTFDERRWQLLARTQFGDEDVQQNVLSAVRTVYERLRQSNDTLEIDPWRMLTIPVELPSLSVLNLVHLTPAFKRTEVGHPLTVKMSIRPTFAWAGAEDNLPKRVPLTYDMTASLDDWLISGRKKGEFEAEEGEETEVLLTLVALRPGSLFLPSVAIRTAPAANRRWTCETQHRNASATVEVLPITARTTFLIDLEGVRGGHDQYRYHDASINVM